MKISSIQWNLVINSIQNICSLYGLYNENSLYLRTRSVFFEMFSLFLPKNTVKDYRQVYLFAKLGQIIERWLIGSFRLQTVIFVRKIEVEFFFRITGSFSSKEVFYRQVSLWNIWAFLFTFSGSLKRCRRYHVRGQSLN